MFGCFEHILDLLLLLQVRLHARACVEEDDISNEAVEVVRERDEPPDVVRASNEGLEHCQTLEEIQTLIELERGNQLERAPVER